MQQKRMKICFVLKVETFFFVFIRLGRKLKGGFVALHRRKNHFQQTKLNFESHKQ
jgi:hypothetical protein